MKQNTHRSRVIAFLFLCLISPLPSAATQIVTVDGAGASALGVSVDHNSAGNPTLTYISPELTLKLATCLSECSSPNPVWQVVVVDDSSGTFFSNPTLRHNLLGNPVIAYHDHIGDLSKLATCLANCLSANPTWRIVVIRGGSPIPFSLQFDASGNPLMVNVLFYDEKLGLTTCISDCQSASPTWRFAPIYSGVAIGITSMQQNDQGNPVVSFYDYSSFDLKLATCISNCKSANPSWTIVTVDDLGNVGIAPSLRMNAAGNPVISYSDLTTHRLKLATCTANCKTNNPTWEIGMIDSADSGVAYSSLQVDAAGGPVISYQFSDAGVLKIAQCTAHCQGANPVWNIVDIDAPVWGHNINSFQLNRDGNAVVAYIESSQLSSNQLGIRLATIELAQTVTAMPNPSANGGVLNCASGAGGTLAAAVRVNIGSNAFCTASPDAGFRTTKIEGCGGIATGVGVNNFTSAPVTQACQVTATFAPITVGQCGGAQGAAAVLPPSSGLCASGAPTTVLATSSEYRWTCSGSVTAGSLDDASCRATRQYSVTGTASPNGGGQVSCTPNAVNVDGSSLCSATPSSGYFLDQWTGDCTGRGSCSLSNIASNKLVTAVFVPNLGNATLGGGPFQGITVSPNGGGAASAHFTTTGNSLATCRFDSDQTAFVAPPALHPIPGATLPQGMFKFRIIGCTPGFTARVSVTWPRTVGDSYTKYGYVSPTDRANERVNYFPPNALQVVGNVATFTITDGQHGDNDWASNGEISDPTGPVAFDPSALLTVPVPGPDRGAMILLALILLIAGGRSQNRSTHPRFQ